MGDAQGETTATWKAVVGGLLCGVDFSDVPIIVRRENLEV